MRKFNKKNKTFIASLSVFAFLLITLVTIFTVYQFKNLNIKYEVESLSYTYDSKKMLVKIVEDAYIKKNVLNNYSLYYKDDKISLYDNPVIYNESKNSLKLLGTFYEIGLAGKVNKLTGENEITDFQSYRIFKISDRRYLITGNNIASKDNLFVTNNYVLIDLDKIGNGYLYNNDVNMKTFSELLIVTPAFTFNVNEELLYINNEEVNLANINGSTNSYVKKETKETPSKEPEEEVQDIVVTRNEVIQNHTDVTVAHKTTILNVKSSVNAISFDYMVYDPFNEYESLYVVYTNTKTKESERKDISLEVNDLEQGNIVINFLEPDTNYNLTFYYTYVDNNESKIVAFDNYNVTTKNISGSIAIEKIGQNVVQYIVKIDDYSLSDCSIVLAVNGVMQNSEKINLESQKYEGSIALNGASKGDFVTLSLDGCYFENRPVNLDISYKFKL